MCLSWPITQKRAHLVTLKEKNSHIDFRCVWKRKGLKLFAPIPSNKNGRECNKNLEVITKATKAQLPK